MILDLRFADIPVEIMTLHEYVAFLERELPALVDKEKARLQAHIDELDSDSPDVGVAFFLESQLESGATMRFLTNSSLMATWALYETAIQAFAAEISKARGITLAVSDLRGSFLQRARKYFDQVLQFELHSPQTDWARLEMLAILRHALAHANGRIPDVKEQDRKRILAWAGSVKGLTIADNEYLVLSVDFVKEALAFVDGLLWELQHRTQQTFPVAA